ncbi:MAG: hypothetical protein ACI8RD_006508 [Bacillariaceae sp.]|jgi:hypothetical protein
MEELQDAIEDAQYVNAIATQEEGPRPVLSWEIPDEEQLAEWEEKKKKEGEIKYPTGGPEVFGIDWCLQSAIGFFLFSEFLKDTDTCNDYLRINFIEEIIRWRRLRGNNRLEKAKMIIDKYLSEQPKDSTTGQCICPEKTQIVSYDIYRKIPSLTLSDEGYKNLYSANKVSSDASSSVPNCLGISGPVLDEIHHDVALVDENRTSNGSLCLDDGKLRTSKELQQESADTVEAVESLPDRQSVKEQYATMKQLTQSIRSKKDVIILSHLFVKVDMIIIESLRIQYWQQFTESEQYTKMKNFLWFYDRQVVAEDFFSMRVLGRGGFGLVTGK